MAFIEAYYAGCAVVEEGQPDNLEIESPVRGVALFTNEDYTNAKQRNFLKHNHNTEYRIYMGNDGDIEDIILDVLVIFYHISDARANYPREQRVVRYMERGRQYDARRLVLIPNITLADVDRIILDAAKAANVEPISRVL